MSGHSTRKLVTLLLSSMLFHEVAGHQAQRQLHHDKVSFSVASSGAARVASSSTANAIIREAKMPSTIKELAVSLLGEEGAQMLARAATSSKVHLAGHPFTLWSRSSDDTQRAVTREFGDKGSSLKDYKYDELGKAKAGIAVDVGGNIGDTSLLAMACNSQLQLMTFEASPQTYVFLKWNILVNHIPEITENDIISGSGKPGILAIHAAATGDGKPIEFKYAPERSYNAMMGSSVTAWGGEVAAGHLSGGSARLNWVTTTVPGFSLADWFTKHDVPKPVWFKMDCEGCEYDTLVDLHSAGILDHALVVGEVHPRKLKESCRGRMDDHECQSAAKAMADTKTIACKQFAFVSCSRVIHCEPFQAHC